MALIPFSDLLFDKSKGMVKTAGVVTSKDHAPDAGDQTKKMEGQNYDPYEKAKKDSEAEKDKQLKLAQGMPDEHLFRELLDAGNRMAGELGKEAGASSSSAEEWHQLMGQLGIREGPPNTLPGSEPERPDPGSIGHTAKTKHAQADRCPKCGGGMGTIPRPGAPGEVMQRCVNCGYTSPVEYNRSLGQPEERGGNLVGGGPGSFASEYPEFEKEAGCVPHETKKKTRKKKKEDK